VETVFASELDRRSGAARERLLDALDVACSATTWEALRRHRSLSPQRARRVMTEMLTALLAEPKR
jgi:hypothetical protein